MRLFIGIFLPETVQAAVEKARANAPRFPWVRWVPTAQCHVTLKFLGERDENLKQTVANSLPSIAASHQPFSLQLRGGGVFPSIEETRVFWVGIKDEEKRLKRLAESCEAAVESLGVMRENRSFKPHVTVGRVEGHSPPVTMARQFSTLFDNFETPLFQVSELVLVKSTLQPTGSRYEIVTRAPLGS